MVVLIPDHVTYASLCHLSVRACVRSKERGVQRVPEFAVDDQSLKVLHYGECRELLAILRKMWPTSSDLSSTKALGETHRLDGRCHSDQSCSVCCNSNHLFIVKHAHATDPSLKFPPNPALAQLEYPSLLPPAFVHTVHISLTQSALCTFWFVRGASLF